jgi:S-adenosylmethionine decarboxylase proenzyme
MKGLHIVANFYNCQFYQNQTISETALLEKAIEFCEKAGLNVVGKSSYQFVPQGFTFAILLAESHLSIHTWPEDGNVAFDIYTCNYQHDNSNKTKQVYQWVKDLLMPKEVEYKEINRDNLNTH